jgi:hypothetical protein
MTASERAGGGENAVIPVRVRWFDDLVAAPGQASAIRSWSEQAVDRLEPRRGDAAARP